MNNPKYFQTEITGIGVCYVKLLDGNSMLVVTKKTSEKQKTLSIVQMSGVISTRGTLEISKYDFDQNYNAVIWQLTLLKNTD